MVINVVFSLEYKQMEIKIFSRTIKHFTTLDTLHNQNFVFPFILFDMGIELIAKLVPTLDYKQKLSIFLSRMQLQADTFQASHNFLSEVRIRL